MEDPQGTNGQQGDGFPGWGTPPPYQPPTPPPAGAAPWGADTPGPRPGPPAAGAGGWPPPGGPHPGASAPGPAQPAPAQPGAAQPGGWPYPPAGAGYPPSGGAYPPGGAYPGWGGWGPPPPPGWNQPVGGPGGQWQPRRRSRSASSVAVTTVLVLIAVLAGIGIGHSLPSSTTVSASASGGLSSPASGGSGATSPATLPGGFTIPGQGSNGSGSQSGSGPANAAAIAAKVSPDLVDINTDLSYLGEEAAGTGIVLTSNGLVLTNNHVINGATSIKARDIGNNRTYTAVVVGYVESSDVAVIQLQDASGLKTATLGHSNGVKTGTPVVAIGNAGGVGGSPSVAPGTITATNQSITASDEGSGTSEKLVGLLETDADIQPGDSGGSLVNVDGQVIGMDTAASQGFSFNQSGTQGFAIPVDTATVLASQIEGHHGSATVHIGATAFLGVAFTSAAVGASTTTISKVIPATAAQAVGLAAGDVITTFGGHPVSNPSVLTELLVSHHPGDRVAIAWTTPSGESRTATVTLGAGPAA